MGEPRQRAGLPEEPLRPPGRGQLGPEDLDGDGPVQAAVPPQEDVGHAPGAEAALHEVMGGETLPETTEQGRHGSPGGAGRGTECNETLRSSIVPGPAGPVNILAAGETRRSGM